MSKLKQKAGQGDNSSDSSTSEQTPADDNFLAQQIGPDAAGTPSEQAAPPTTQQASTQATPPPSSADVDLTTEGNFGQVGDAFFAADLFRSAGSGNFNPFVQLQHDVTEQGYNTDFRPQEFNEKSNANHNHSILLANVPTFVGDGTAGTVEGVVYREFMLDANELTGGDNPLLSLDKLQIWQEEAGNLTHFTPGTGFAGAHTNHLVYDLDAGGDHWVALNAGNSTGGGQSDMRLFIPDSLFVNDVSHRYVTLYSAFGYQGDGWTTSGGAEEWGVRSTGSNSGSAFLGINKTATVPGGTADTVGEDISYSITVSNTGGTNLTGVTVTDPFVSGLTRGSDISGNNDNVLNVGEIWSFTAHYTVTQADIDSNGGGDGNIENTATADSDQTAPVSASAAVAVELKSHFSVTKTAVIPDSDHDSKIDSPADDVSYTITLVNDGNTTQHDVLVNDSLLGPLTTHTETGGTGTNGDDVLDVGETWTYTAGYDVQQADIDNRGSVDGTSDDNIHNEANVSSDEFVGSASANVAIDYRPHLTIDKTAQIPDADHDGKIDSPADDISYTITVANDGNVTLTNVQLNDTLLGLLTTHTETGGTGINGDNILNVGETWTYTAGYDVQQADIDNRGSVDGTADDNIHNTASVATNEGASGSDSADVPIDYRPSVTLTKDASVPGNTADAAGELIQYTIAVANSGNVTLTNPVVSDTFVSNLHGLDLNEDGFNDGDINHDGKLSVGETWQYLANHVVTQADIDSNGGGDGTIDNTASVTTDQGASSSDGASVPVEQRFAIGLDKEGVFADDNHDGYAEVGEHINYTFAVSNGGNATLHNVGVTDVNGDVPVSGGTIASLAPGATDTTTWSASYAITQSDIDNGYFDNSAVAIADEASTPDTAHVELPPAPPSPPAHWDI